MKARLMGLLTAFRHNLLLKIASLLLSIVLWVGIVTFINPDVTEKLNDIKVNIDLASSVLETQGIVLASEFNETVNIDLKMSRDTLLVFNVSKINVYVDLKDAKEGTHNYPIKVDFGSYKIETFNISKETVPLTFEKGGFKEVTVYVTPNTNIKEGYKRGELSFVPDSLTVRGPVSILERIKRASIIINDDAELSQTKTYQDCEYTFLDEDGQEIPKTFLSVDDGYNTITVRIEVNRQKTVPFIINLVNSSGGNENKFVTYSIYPETVEIVGTDSVINQLDSIDLGNIDISKFSEDQTKEEVIITLPTGVKFGANAAEKVIVDFDFGALSTKSLRVSNIQPVNLPDNFSVTLINKSINVKFRGLRADIDKLTQENVSIVLDFGNNADLSTGRSSARAFVVFPDELNVGVIGQYTVEVNVS